MKFKSILAIAVILVLGASCTEEKEDASDTVVVDEYAEPKTACECVDMQVESLETGEYHTEVFGVCESLLTGKTEDEQVEIHEAYVNCPKYKILEAEFGSILQDPGMEVEMEVNNDIQPLEISTIIESK